MYIKLRFLSKPILISLVIMTISCNHIKEKVDTIIIGSKIYTVNNKMDIVQAMAIKDGKIIATGSVQEIENKYIANETQRFDSSYIFPGFIDAHCHFLGYGSTLMRYADLTKTKSFDEVIDIMKEFDFAHPDNQWILGRGWDQNEWEIKDFPTREKLDEIWPNKPIVLIRIDGHAVITNGKALELAGFDINTRISGGNLLKNGITLTGVLLDNAADSIKDMIPELSEKEILQALKAAEKNCFAVGLTSVVDAGLNTRDLKAIQAAQDSNLIKMNIYAMLSPTKSNFETYLKNGIIRNDRLHVQSVKLYADGAMGSRGACMILPYSDDIENHGLIITSEEELLKYCKMIYDVGYQLNTHAIGDSAVRMVLNSYAQVLKGTNDRRWRIEHSQVVHPNDFSLFRKYNIIPAVNTTHATSDMNWAEQRLGSERIKSAYAYKSLLEQNGWFTNGSDFPIESINPILGFYAGVSRRDANGNPKDGFNIYEALSREEALKAMTIWAARGSFEETEKGSLEVGKNADFVIINQDIMNVPEIDIPNTEVIMTWSRGEMVFRIHNE